MLRSVLLTSTSTIYLNAMWYMYIYPASPDFYIKGAIVQKKSNVREHSYFSYFFLFYFIYFIPFIYLLCFYALKQCILPLSYSCALCNCVPMNPSAVVIFSCFRDNHFTFVTLLYISNLSLNLL